jgi:hypothetical protein
MESQIPNYPSLPPQLICQLHNVTMHVSLELYGTSVSKQEIIVATFVFHQLCCISSSG